MLHVLVVGTMIRPAAHVSQSALPGALALPASQSWQTRVTFKCDGVGWNLPATQKLHNKGTSVINVEPLGHTPQVWLPGAEDFPVGQVWQLVSAFSEAEPYCLLGHTLHEFNWLNGFNSGLDM